MKMYMPATATQSYNSPLPTVNLNGARKPDEVVDVRGDEHPVLSKRTLQHRRVARLEQAAIADMNSIDTLRAKADRYLRREVLI
jgi:hypothetical protein